jgi:hypothetical protein
MSYYEHEEINDAIVGLFAETYRNSGAMHRIHMRFLFSGGEGRFHTAAPNV